MARRGSCPRPCRIAGRVACAVRVRAVREAIAVVISEVVAVLRAARALGDVNVQDVVAGAAAAAGRGAVDRPAVALHHDVVGLPRDAGERERVGQGERRARPLYAVGEGGAVCADDVEVEVAVQVREVEVDRPVLLTGEGVDVFGAGLGAVEVRLPAGVTTLGCAASAQETRAVVEAGVDCGRARQRLPNRHRRRATGHGGGRGQHRQEDQEDSEHSGTSGATPDDGRSHPMYMDWGGLDLPGHGVPDLNLLQSWSPLG